MRRAPDGGIIGAFNVVCPVCGTYGITEEAIWSLERRTDPDRVRLTWATREASDASVPLFIFEKHVREILKSTVVVNPVDKADRLLQLLASRSTGLGDPAPFNSNLDWPSVHATGPDEFDRLLGALSHGLLVATDIASPGHVTLTFQGWQRSRSLAVDAQRLLPHLLCRVALIRNRRYPLRLDQPTTIKTRL